MTILEIANLIGGNVIGDGGIVITRMAKIEEAKAGDLTFLSNPKYEKYLEQTAASGVIIGSSFDERNHTALPPALIKVDDPYTAFVVALERLDPQPEPIAPGIHPAAVIAPSATLGEGCAIGAHVVIGERCVVGAATKILANAVICDRVTIGSQCLIYPNVTIREDCILGDRVILQPGSWGS
jgi:UDP-3-O-[3-hydroxymyristoyl] glucosamine N-acyltransferase